MTTKTLNGKVILAVEVNASANNLKVSPAGWLIGYLTLQKLPQGQWSILGRAKDITEEQAMGLMEKLTADGNKFYYRDYLGKCTMLEVDLKRTALESFQLWLKAEGIKETDLLLIKNNVK